MRAARPSGRLDARSVPLTLAVDSTRLLPSLLLHSPCEGLTVYVMMCSALQPELSTLCRLIESCPPVGDMIGFDYRLCDVAAVALFWLGNLSSPGRGRSEELTGARVFIIRIRLVSQVNCESSLVNGGNVCGSLTAAVLLMLCAKVGHFAVTGGATASGLVGDLLVVINFERRVERCACTGDEASGIERGTERMTTTATRQ
ncbi:unnamed protein product [Pleuronectes platessa]|uniref:Uncharacterized protein n=1 Tax=Pleuronectes platessa TaxID=8262 RepID=A0A9N7TTV8_PLEPL|nr:unnamed protein product [Pleuronectes platessa]